MGLGRGVDFVSARAIDLPQECRDARFLAGARRTVEKEVGQLGDGCWVCLKTSGLRPYRANKTLEVAVELLVDVEGTQI
jgi:hypothetical protein